MNMFSEEVSITTRKSMAHLSAMKPEDFIGWLKTVKREAKGILSNYKTSLNNPKLIFYLIPKSS